MERRVWCAIAGRDRLLHVDATNCGIVYDLRKAAVDLSRIKIPYIRVDIWKVKDPKGFPVSDFSALKRIRNDDDELRTIAELLYPHKGLETIFVGDSGENDIKIIMQINSKRRNLPSISVPATWCSQKRRIWCGIAGQDRIFQVEVSKCKDAQDLKKAVARESDLPVNALDLWKLKEPQRWPLNDRIRKRIPHGKERLGEVADQLAPDTPIDVTAMFDDAIRKDSVYLVASISGKRELRNSNSTSSSTARRLAWCAIPGQSRLFQVEVESWQNVSELKDAVLRRSGFTTQPVILTKVKNPHLWPINRDTRSVDIPVSGEYIYSISDPLDDRTPDAILDDDFDEDTLQLILVLPLEYTPPDSSSTSDSETSERYLWCAIAGRDQVLRVDASSCEVVSQLRNALISEGRLGLRNDQIWLWKVTDPLNWSVEDVVTGDVKVPRLREDLQEIATELYSGRYIEREFGGELHKDKVYVIIQILNERSSSSSSSSSSSTFDKGDPLSDRADIRKALKEHGFGDDIFQDLDRNHVGDVFREDGERFILKYLRPGRCDEIKVLRYLSRFDSPQNHAPIKFIVHDLDEGAILLTRHLGSPVLDYLYLCEDLLQIIQQILEGVAFLHSKLVVHMDLKPSHILIGESTRVWIIDYDLSEIVDNEDKKVSGYRGTKGCTAPEVGRKAYNPMKADVWAIGKLLQELCDRCPLHKDRKLLDDLCTSLLDKRPEKRPSMQDAYRRIVDYSVSPELSGS